MEANDSLASLPDINNETYYYTATPTPTGPSKSDYDVARYVYFYGLAVILPVGLVCNLLSFGVFLTSRSMRRTTTGHYLSALAVADTVFLVGELLRWMNSFDSQGQILGISFMDTITFWCRSTFFLRYSGKLASAWITVIISAERFITVAYPLRVSRISTPKIAKITIALIFVVCSGIGAYPFWTLGLRDYTNGTYCGYLKVEAYELWSMFVLRIGSLFLPSAIIFVFTGLLIIVLRRAKKRRASQLEGQDTQGTATSNMDFQLTIMLLSVAIAFLVLRLPYTISYYLNDYKEEIWVPLDRWFSYRIYLANKICDLIAITNYAVNFFLYCLCGGAFRSRLLGMLTCGRRDSNRRRSSATISSKLSTRSSASVAVAKVTRL